jgi:hypothetical protein
VAAVKIVNVRWKMSSTSAFFGMSFNLLFKDSSDFGGRYGSPYVLLTRYYMGDQIKDDGTNWHVVCVGERKNIHKVSVEKCEETT